MTTSAAAQIVAPATVGHVYRISGHWMHDGQINNLGRRLSMFVTLGSDGYWYDADLADTRPEPMEAVTVGSDAPEIACLGATVDQLGVGYYFVPDAGELQRIGMPIRQIA